jgi:predicted aminopeptidase
MRVFLFLLPFIMGCSKTSYVLKQGIGQVGLEWSGRSNEDVLNDSRVEEKYKKKIRDIIQYKNYFYKYFEKEDSGIYDETTFLDQKAVTYLVIAAPYDKLEPLKISFPVAGEFPYLGFFSEDDAKDYQKEKQKEGYQTYLRPVYAYSTLDQWIFDDNILSSFFYLKEHDLAELIFHELIHTVFFVKNEVDLNESLAQYFGERMAEQYFKYDDEDIKQLKRKKLKRDEYSRMVSTFAKEMKDIYDKKKLSRKEAEQKLKHHTEKIMTPRFKAFCKQYEMKKCHMLDETWNNARLAAFLTYQKEQNLIEKIHKKHDFSLKKLLALFEKHYKKYTNRYSKMSFTEYLKKEEKL